MPRSVFQTGTFKAASFGSALAAIALVTPFVANIAQRYAPDQKTRDTIADIAGLLMAVTGPTGLATTVLGVATNRASAKDRAYSPSWLTGFNKEDCIQPLSMDVPKVDMHERVAAMAAQQWMPKTEGLQPERFLDLEQP